MRAEHGYAVEGNFTKVHDFERHLPRRRPFIFVFTYRNGYQETYFGRKWKREALKEAKRNRIGVRVKKVWLD